MDLVRWQKSPWGMDLLQGLSWDLAWAALGLGILFAVGHGLITHLHSNKWPTLEVGDRQAALKSLPVKIVRHNIASRSFHWIMALSVLTLLFTAFLPLLGLKFPWVTAHWIAGFVLTGAVLFHLVHTTFFKSLGLMWIDAVDRRALWTSLRQLLDPQKPNPPRSGKNPVENKLFHHGVATATLITVVTGLIMMAKVDTPWWNRNPYLLSDEVWGIVYLLHDLGSIGLIAMVVVHLYFAFRPDKLWITLSMFRGWISRERFLERHDPALWPPRSVKEDAVKNTGGKGT